MYKPTQEEDELIDRALEAANSQVISLHNMARDFFGDILDVDDEILEDVDMDMCMDGGGGGIVASTAASDDGTTMDAGTSAAAAAAAVANATASTTSMLVQPNGGSASAAGLDVRGMVHT